MIPKGWRETTLGNIGQIRSGSTPERASHERYYVDGVWPWVKTMDLTNSTICDTDERITDAALSESSCALFPEGTVLVAMYGGLKQIGRTGILTTPSAVNQAISAIALDHKVAHPMFVLHWLNGRVGLWKSFAASSRKDPNITRADVCQFPVYLPPLPEQRRIAAALSTWDEAISVTSRLLAIGRKKKQILIDELICGSGRKDSSEWRKASLKEVASVAVSSVNKKHQAGERSVRLCNYTDVYYNENINAGLSFQEATASESEIAKFSVQCGDVLITKDSETPSDIAVSAYVAEDIPDLVCGYHLAIIRPDTGQIDPLFLHNYFALRRTRAYFASQANGATRFGLPVGAIQSAPIWLPNIQMQRRISRAISAISDEITYLRRDLDALKTQKRALMQQLLTGKRRLLLPEPAETANA
jgi:type I restriction enzyme S subunit